MIHEPQLAAEISRLEEENLRLRRAVDELSIINDLARTISASLDQDEITRIIVRRSLRSIGAGQGVITLVGEQSSDPMKTLVRASSDGEPQEQFHLNQSLLGWMHLNHKPLVIDDPRSDQRFQGLEWGNAVRSVLCVPMMIRSELKGVITLYNKQGGGGFTTEDTRLLAIIAAQSAQVVENARLNRQERALLKMHEEMAVAARIQADLLPQEAPAFPGYDIAGRTVPAQVIGGDYFDFIRIDDDRLAFCLGDVSGKGIPASLLMANVQATLRGQTQLTASPAECLQRSNRLLYASTAADKFVTLLLGVVDRRNQKMQFSNAGQNYPVVVEHGQPPRPLTSSGLALSVLDDFAYEEESVAMAPGDMIVVVSDGITEAVNASDEQFGEARLAEIIQGPGSAGEIVDRIIDAVRSHAASQQQMDDMTIVVVQRTRE
jgi:phosphoserine phosphatase RsbU/P